MIVIFWLFALWMCTAQCVGLGLESRSTLRVLGAMHGVLRNFVVSAEVQVHLESKMT